jgi:hypothetical protein
MCIPLLNQARSTASANDVRKKRGKILTSKRFWQAKYPLLLGALQNRQTTLLTEVEGLGGVYGTGQIEAERSLLGVNRDRVQPSNFHVVQELLLQMVGV